MEFVRKLWSSHPASPASEDSTGAAKWQRCVEMTPTAIARIRAAVLVVDGGFSVTRATGIAGVGQSNFTAQKWAEH